MSTAQTKRRNLSRRLDSYNRRGTMKPLILVAARNAAAHNVVAAAVAGYMVDASFTGDFVCPTADVRSSTMMLDLAIAGAGHFARTGKWAR